MYLTVIYLRTYTIKFKSSNTRHLPVQTNIINTFFSTNLSLDFIIPKEIVKLRVTNSIYGIHPIVAYFLQRQFYVLFSFLYIGLTISVVAQTGISSTDNGREQCQFHPCNDAYDVFHLFPTFFFSSMHFFPTSSCSCCLLSDWLLALSFVSHSYICVPIFFYCPVARLTRTIITKTRAYVSRFVVSFVGIQSCIQFLAWS